MTRKDLIRILGLRSVRIIALFGIVVFALLVTFVTRHSDALSEDNPAAVYQTNDKSDPSFKDIRASFQTHILDDIRDGWPADLPPAGLFNLVKYPSPVGPLDAYVSPDPGDGKKHPAIVWLKGGLSNSIDNTAWDETEPRSNDQSATVFRKSGILMMYPSRRGGNENPGHRECFYGEVDDIVAATQYLKKLPYVDPNRVYLGGHSTGGTLALLIAECSEDYRAIFSFGPVAAFINYGDDYALFDKTDKRELYARAPILWLKDIRNPCFVLEGDSGGNNHDQLKMMQEHCDNPNVRFLTVHGADHFAGLRPVSELIVKKILADTDPQRSIQISTADVDAAMAGEQKTRDPRQN